MTNKEKTNRTETLTTGKKTRILILSLISALSLAILIGLSFHTVPTSATKKTAATKQTSEKAVKKANKKAIASVREGEHLSIDAIVKEEPKTCEEGYTLVTLKNSDGAEYILLSDGESEIKKGDRIKADCEVAGMTTTSEGVGVPLLEIVE